MSDLEILLGAFPRIHFACRSREVRSWKGALTEHQARILGHLDDRDPTMVGELAEAMGVTPSTMSLNLKRLEAGGFVVRTRDPEDRRVMNVVLTEPGRALRDAATMLDPDRSHALLTDLRPDERRRALEGIAILADAADRLVARGAEHGRALSGEGSSGEGRSDDGRILGNAAAEEARNQGG